MSEAVFAYGSLVLAESAASTLGRPVPPEPERASLSGWRRRWSQARDNLTAEKTFALPGGELPPFVLALNVEPGEDEAGPVNGALIEVAEAELERLDVREIRYDRVEVTSQIRIEGDAPFDRVWVYTAKPERLAAEPPPGAVILATYVGAVEAAFEAIGPEQLDAFRRTTGPPPVEVVDAVLARDRIPSGNPRQW